MTYAELLRERLPEADITALEEFTRCFCVKGIFPFAEVPFCHMYCGKCWTREIEKQFPPSIKQIILDKFNKLW